jgi:hypothetical protein
MKRIVRRRVETSKPNRSTCRDRRLDTAQQEGAAQVDFFEPTADQARTQRRAIGFDVGQLRQLGGLPGLEPDGRQAPSPFEQAVGIR